MIDVGLMLRNFRVVMTLGLGLLVYCYREMELGSWLPAIGRSRRYGVANVVLER